MPVGTNLKARIRSGFSSVGYIVRASQTAADSTSPTISTGTGVPSASEPDGSIYLRADGAAATTLYVRAAGAWVAK